MSRYARFACVSCRIQLWLGKAIFEAGSKQPAYFQIGSPENGTPLNFENPILNKVLWKMLADHASHSIHVFVEGDPGDDELGDYTEIGGENLDKDISFEDYLKGWSGWSDLRQFPGSLGSFVVTLKKGIQAAADKLEAAQIELAAKQAAAEQAAAEPPSYLKDSISNIGDNAQSYNKTALNGYEPGAAFSGSYDPKTGQFLAQPSGTTVLSTGNLPANLVDRFGCHDDVNQQLSALGADPNKTAGFVVFYDAPGQLSISWNSGSINLANFGNRTVPLELRPQIIAAIEKATGFNVTSR